ncbi:hypothetical protein FQN50_002803 [Emmonsiellopsis sp. PD_5]|nr:hypothetical protein FQN50_002803 [Emmonsiellopsis sp. PD_5]
MSSTRTIFGPLPTAFTPPPACSTPYVDDHVFSGSSPSTVYMAHYGSTCGHLAPGTDVLDVSTSCYPSPFGSFLADPTQIFTTMVFFSPAPVCPDGFKAECTITRREGDSPPTATDSMGRNSATSVIWEQLSAGESAIGCCPSGFKCDEQHFYGCTTTLDYSQIITGTGYEDGCKPTPTTMTVQTVSGTSGGAAYRIQLLQTSPSTQLSTQTTTTSQTTTDPTGTISPVPQESGGLATSTKITLGVVIPVAAFIIALLLFIIWRRRRKSSPQSAIDDTQPSQVQPSAAIIQPIPEKRAAPEYTAPLKSEIDTYNPPVFEANSSSRFEMDSPAMTQGPPDTHNPPVFEANSSTRFEMDSSAITQGSPPAELPDKQER